MRRVLIAVAVSLGLAACTESDPVAAPSQQDIGPAFSAAGAPQNDRYIVVFRAGVGDPDALADQLIRAHGGQEHYRYRHALLGFAASLPAPAIEAIRRNPNVAYIEADAVVTTLATQTNATWGLDRIDQRALPLSTTYSYEVMGAGVHAYIVDTGLRATHSEFSGRLGNGFTAIADGRGTDDCNGHGTHVGGTVGGTVYGVAKGVTLHAVRVLNCQGSGTTSGVIAGVDWVTANAVKPAVANMSLGGGASTSLDNAVANSINAGITYAVAAGNSNANACNYSPARVATALTVGATTSTDARASYSNFGSCVDLFAPGSSIKSAWYTSNTATNTISGTSMASPHVAGVAALYLSASGNASKSPSQVGQAMVANATTGVVGGAGSGSPNLLLYSVFTGGDTPPPAGETKQVHIGGLTAVTSKSGPNWRALVTATVLDASNSPVSGATVAGNWSTGGSATCTTVANGTCTVQSANFKNNVGSTTFTVIGITGSNMSYSAASNTQSSITVAKP